MNFGGIEQKDYIVSNTLELCLGLGMRSLNKDQQGREDLAFSPNLNIQTRVFNHSHFQIEANQNGEGVKDARPVRGPQIDLTEVPRMMKQ
jgi:hypothetical protein